MLTTKERWSSLCRRLETSHASENLIATVYDGLYMAYTEPWRHYHNLNHINDGLRKLAESSGLASNPDAVEMAWWWHDAVCDPTSKFNDNEETSAALANSILKRLIFSNNSLASVELRITVVRLILATKHDHIPESKDGRLIVDVDLASLGTPQEVFDLNTANIRKEYAHVSDEDFIRGRAQFFRKFLESRPSIYLTEYFKDKYEAAAQENLKRVMAAAS